LVAPNTDYTFIVGSINMGINIFKGNLAINTNTAEGESGSPVLNERGEVSGIMMGGTESIDVVLKAIDSIDK
jgi:V8-like Glu-specific endopeptidase